MRIVTSTNTTCIGSCREFERRAGRDDRTLRSAPDKLERKPLPLRQLQVSTSTWSSDAPSCVRTFLLSAPPATPERFERAQPHMCGRLERLVDRTPRGGILADQSQIRTHTRECQLASGYGMLAITCGIHGDRASALGHAACTRAVTNGHRRASTDDGVKAQACLFKRLPKHYRCRYQQHQHPNLLALSRCHLS